MSYGWARGVLTAYRLAGSLAYPMLGAYVGWRASRGKEDPLRRRERYGFTAVARPDDAPVIWVHAASIGESAAVTPLVRAIAAEGFRIVMTTGTVASATLVGERLSDAVIHQYVPLDLKPSVSRFLDHWRPELAIVAESEIWPMTLMELGKRRIPQVLVNARLSDRSFRRWRAVPYLAEALLENLAHIVAQSEVDGERYHMLGARAVTVAGNLKADTTPPPLTDRTEALEIAQAVGRRPTFAAISTHEGEEVMIAQVQRKLTEKHPRLLSIIVPRHVERGADIARELQGKGFRVARRSLGELPDPTTDIFLGDTVGEMGLYLRLTEIAFVGKSLSGEGGQNPLEAAMLGSAILSGRYVQNFRDIYQRLLKNGGARIVRDADQLAEQIDVLLTEPETRTAMITNAKASVVEMRGALSRTMQALEPFLHPMRLSLNFDRRHRTGNGR
ncbi:3-deoxy-D-manno-octulosonic acid transferase [Aureimonas fodinaquatilis]|uniref:3-deoxy-D-manno-octulosonic acid transferase n=1 Tax=Aureimonas fodinaquatilis TaxID=2565783 RepID=A0A5B0DZI6_9HYPH|nr:lipid IV(A) 3-deoxy-D-manno-octulosonic acid transferase [Aureimonas fodinaquatilis]KAA0972214.1 3-deoxy-D-manno-octulosonic acid transferase [Aureimonas fodinaquatilis]